MKKTLTFSGIALVLCVLCTVCAGALKLESVESVTTEFTATPAEHSAALADTDKTSVYLAANAVYSGVPEGATVDVGKTDAIYDAAAGTITGSGYAGPVTITAEDGTKTTVIFCAPTKWKPGLNLLTGTEMAFTMDSAEAIKLTFSTSKTGTQRGTIEQAVFPHNGTNYALKLTNATAAAVTVYTKNDFSSIDKARPIQLSFNSSRSGAYPFYTLTNGTTNLQYKPVNLKEAANPDTLIWSSAGKGTPTAGNCPSSIISLAIQAQHNVAGAVTYLDDIEYIPYYKITYHLPNGTESNEYVLYSSGTNRMTEYTVKTDNYPTLSGKICIGWATEEGSSDPINAVPLVNEDVDLYPVWKGSTLIDTVPVYMDASASYTLTVLDTEADIRWTVDVGESEAVFDEKTLTLTGKGYAGTVTFTASAGDIVETKYIHLCAPTKWKPGLNFLTGTVEPFDMESEEAIQLSFTTQTVNAGVRGEFSCVNDPTSDVGNHVIKLTRSGYAATTLYNAKALAVPIEAARPVHTEFEYHFSDAEKKEFYILLNYTSNTVYKHFPNLTKTSSLVKASTDDGKNANAITGMAIQTGPN